MASNREERFLMRQRGAGTRQVQDISFNLALPGLSNPPLRPQRSGRSIRTPQPGLAPQRSSRKTPNSTQRLQPQPSSRRTPSTLRKTLRTTEPRAPYFPPPVRTPGTSRNRLPQRPSPYDIPRNEDKEQLQNSQPSRRDEQGSVTKKRKLGASAVGKALPLPHPQSAMSTAQAKGPTTEQYDKVRTDARDAPKNLKGSGEKKRKKRKSKGQLFGKRKRPSLEQAVASSGDQGATPESAPIAPAKSSTSNGIAEVPEASLTPQRQVQDSRPIRKKRKSIGVIPKTRRKSTMLAPGKSTTVEPPGNTGKDAVKGQVFPKETTGRGRDRPRKAISAVEEDEEERLDRQENAAKSKMRAQPRKSLPVIQDDPEHLETTTDSAKSTRGRPRKSLPVVEEDEEEEAEQMETVNDLAYRRPQGRPRKSDASLEVIDETQPTRASQSSTKKSNDMPRHARASSDTSGTTTKTPRAKKDSIPITVHRLSRVRALVFEDDDQDILAGPAPFPKKSGVNAIDVLGQICREMIAKSVDTLGRGAKNEGHGGRRAEWKRKRKAVEMFRGELDGRLFQMTEALDNNFALSTRLKHANKEKIALREELLDLRREREKIALRTDEIRRSHTKASKAAQEDNDLNTMLHDIELAVQRGRAQPDNGSDDGNQVANGLEVLMQNVATTVSSANGPGLLDRVKGFNAYLERAISAMNARS